MSAIGSEARRQDAAAKLTGEAVYGVDLSAPGMLHAAVVRSTVSHAWLRGISAGRALVAPGVRAVLTAVDAPAVRHGVAIQDQTMLAADRVRYRGEALAVVVADSAAAARAARALVDVEYDELPALFDPERAMAPESPLLHPGWREYTGGGEGRRHGNVCAHTEISHGDVDAAFAAAELVVEDTYHTQIAHQCPIEPHAALARWDADGGLTVTTSTQFPFGVRATLCGLFSLPTTRVRVIASTVGGGFGAKLDVAAEPLAALASRRLRRPVKLVFDRAEELVAGQPRHPAMITVRSALRRDGTILARDTRIVLDAGAYAGDTPVIVSVAAALGGGPYRIPAIRVESFGVHTNKQNFGAYRGPSGPQMVFAIESHTDRIARELDIDPLELRRRHHYVEGDVALNGQVLEGVGLGEALERAAAAIGWGSPKRPNRGRGVACTWWLTTGGSSAAQMELDQDGMVTVRCGGTEIGTGAVTSGLPLVVAEELTVSADRVRMVTGDTAATPYDFGSQGSRTLYNLGNAVRQAAGEIRRQLLERAAERMEVDVADLELRDGAVQVRGAPARQVSIAELAADSLWNGGPILGHGAFLAPPAPYDADRVRGSVVPSFNAPTFATHAVEVEVDPETGEVRLVDYVAAHDVGRLLNPVYAQGQVQGGVTQGIGYALFEEAVVEDGTVLSTDLTSYRIPGALDTVPVRCIFVEHPSKSGPYGAKGLGEPPVIPPAAAIANAVADAIGTHVHRLPLTPPRVFEALRAAEES